MLHLLLEFTWEKRKQDLSVKKESKRSKTEANSLEFFPVFLEEDFNIDDLTIPEHQKFATFSEWSNTCSSKLEENHDQTNFIQLLKPETIICTIQKFNEILDKQLSNKDHWFPDHGTNTTNLSTYENNVNAFVQREMIPKDSNSDFVVIGDIHGKILSLLRILQQLKDKKFLQDNFTISNPNNYIILLGDYTGRWTYGTEVWYTIMRLKIANPNRVIILRGNHEEATMAFKDNFLQEIEKKYPIKYCYLIFDFFEVLFEIGRAHV